MILRICVVIPTFDNSRSVSEVVADVVKFTQFPILVVDDGSENPVTNTLYSWDVRNALEAGRVRVHRLPKNRGKGAALQFAIQQLVSEGFTHMMTMDADGQHYAREVQKLVELAKQNPWDLIIGDRKLKSATVPEISKFGRAFSNFWVNYQTGLHIKDSQSGFRLYPLFPLQNMRFFTKRYDFEIEVLIKLLWQGIHVRETDIEVFYPEKKERVSHFHKFWDNLRISALNTLLVVVSLLKTHRSPRELSVALGLGVAIGCTPFYGFHTLIIMAVAFLLRLNVIMMWLGSHVSTPLLAPLLVWCEIWVGRHWLHVAAGEGKKGDLYQWFAGSAVVGLMLGLGTMIVAFTVSWLVQNRKKRSNWTGRTRGGRFGNAFLRKVIRHMGIETGYKFLLLIVPYFYFFAPKARRGVTEYWHLIHPAESWRERQGRVMRHFYRFGQVLMDRVFQSFHAEKQFETKSEGLDGILQAMEQKGGLIMLGAHAGAWDLAAALLNKNSLSDRVRLVEFQAEGFTFQNVKDKLDPNPVTRLNSGVTADAIFEIHAALKTGQCLGLMGDRPLGDRFELLPFLGKIAPFDVTAFRLAAAARVPLLFTFGFKAKGKSYNFFAGKLRNYTFDSAIPRELQCANWAREYVAEVEKHLNQYPDQWFNFYPFWSALPTTPNGELASRAHNHLLEDLGTPTPLKPGLGSGPTTTGGAES